MSKREIQAVLGSRDISPHFTPKLQQREGLELIGACKTDNVPVWIGKQGKKKGHRSFDNWKVRLIRQYMEPSCVKHSAIL